MFKNFFTRSLPTVKADDEEDLVDPHQELKDKCKETPHAKHYAEKLEECNNRVSSKSRTTETCIEELFDFLHAIDHCVSKDLFSKLK